MPLAARITDLHVCPRETGHVPHVGGPIISGASKVFIGGRPAGRIGDTLICNGPPDTIAEGSSTVFIEGRSAARQGDRTEHGGRIVEGCSKVWIGGATVLPGQASAEFKAEFKEWTGMTLEQSLALYKKQTNEELTEKEVQRLFEDSRYAHDQIEANKNLHTTYRYILNSNVPATEKEAIARGFKQPRFLGSTYLGAYYHDPSNNTKYVDANGGHLEAVYDKQGNLATSKDYQGSFNFFDPGDWYAHRNADMLPYDYWGGN